MNFAVSPSHLGIAVLIVPGGSFFHAQANVSVDITEELSSNVRMSPRVAQRDALSAKVSSQARSMLALFLAWDQYYLSLREAGASRRILSKHGTEELKPVVHLMGIEKFVTGLCVEIGRM